MKKPSKIIFLFILFLSGMFMMPVFNQQGIVSNTTYFENMQGEVAQTGFISKTVRVAIYDEPNMTSPVYDTSFGDNTYNVTYLQSVFTSYGFQVTLLDFQDIYDHQLKTADYDVFVMNDACPRENITLQVMDFWTGGGGILAFDGAGVFLCYFGILPPEALGTDGSPPYWSYSVDDMVINERHPVSKSYAVDDAFDDGIGYNYFGWDFAAMQATSIGADITMIANTAGDSNRASILAFDPSDRGGRVVTIAFEMTHGGLTALNDLYVDAVEWLAPSPKGRILFDYLHAPYYGIDFNEPSTYSANRYSQLRDLWVNHTFTLDKLYPGDVAEITLDLLAKYDMLFINTPNINYTASEISAIRSWISAGGGLLILGEWLSFSERNDRINEILSIYDLAIGSVQYNTMITTNSTFHPINEGITTTHFEGGSYISVTGDAIPIWMDTNGYIAGIQEVGDGRIFLASDINFIANYIGEEDNTQFGLNIANWLCSGGAKILLYTDGITSFGSSYNYYKSPAALALNELGVNYYMSNDRDYFNESLKLQSWDLVIIDANNDAPATSHPLILEHMNSGGKIIWRDFMFRYSAYDYMWNYFGFSGLDLTITVGPPSVYLWDEVHSMFNLPVDYDADNITTSVNAFNTDFTYVSVLDNATALAGISSSYDENQSAIVLGVDGRAICNQFSITQYLDDTDDSTYADGFEIWMNEIAFMLKPTINQPNNIEYTEGDTGNNIVWIGNSELPLGYVVLMDSSPVESDMWFGGEVSYNVDGLTEGTYIFEIILFDRAGYEISDSVTVNVIASTTTTTTTTTTTATTTTSTATNSTITNTTTTSGGGGIPVNMTIIMIVIAGAGIVVVIIIIVFMKKKPT